MKAILAIFSVLLLTSACVTNDAKGGYLTDFVDVSDLKVGESTQEDVRKKLGSPTSTSTFGDLHWYYIGMQFEHAAFMESEVSDRHIIEARFNDEGTLVGLSEHAGENRRDIAVAEDVTPTEGNEITVMEQFLGNLGKFNPGQ